MPIEKLESYDIVFLDPPFHQDLLGKSCQWLVKHNLLANDALIYIENELELTKLPIPENWQILRSKKAGNVNYHLIKT